MKIEKHIIAPFKSGDRVCFIGDSITANSLWVAHINEYYARYTDINVSIVPCGVSGGSCTSALDYFDEQTAVWNPNVAVIMLGMNDVWRDNYRPDMTDENKRLAETALKIYSEKLPELTDKIRSSGVQRIIYLAPTPYDEEQDCEEFSYVGTFGALRKCADMMKDLAEKTGGEFYDFGGEFVNILHELYTMGSSAKLVGGDRVHPTDLGHVVMARLFLAAQGFTELAPTATLVENGSADLKLSDEGNRYLTLVREIEDRWTTEWLIARSSPDQTLEGRLAYAERYPDEEHPGEPDWFSDLARRYRSLVENDGAKREELKELISKMFGSGK
ncbi:MAG: hypothetical protein IJZ03_00730 [Clostridia bacterium]|nr:hypothetical protein [Clostridia bacterium]